MYICWGWWVRQCVRCKVTVEIEKIFYINANGDAKEEEQYKFYKI